MDPTDRDGPARERYVRLTNISTQPWRFATRGSQRSSTTNQGPQPVLRPLASRTGRCPGSGCCLLLAREPGRAEEHQADDDGRGAAVHVTTAAALDVATRVQERRCRAREPQNADDDADNADDRQDDSERPLRAAGHALRTHDSSLMLAARSLGAQLNQGATTTGTVLLPG